MTRRSPETPQNPPSTPIAKGGKGGFPETESAAETRWIEADWPAPPNVRALTTTRGGGVSEGPYTSLNLGVHVGDEPANVARNRLLLARALALPSEPAWLTQHHGITVIDAADAHADRRADGAFTTRPGTVCAILTADCLPILICDRAGREVAALHGGWRGLAGGIIEAGLACLHAPRDELLAWLGPAIGAGCYEVGEEVRRAFVSRRETHLGAFTLTRPGHHLCDLHALARLELAALGVLQVYGGGHCTFTERDRFFSFRRDGGRGRDTGRMASLIWMEPPRA